MKFLLIATATLLTSLYANSQVEFNIFAGPQATSAHYTIADVKQNTKIKAGFQAGVGLKVPFEDKLYFAPAAFYSMKGYKVTFNRFVSPPAADAIDNSTTQHTFELAALLQYDFNNSPDHFYIKAGPSLDFQLFGNEKYNQASGSSVDRKMKYGYADYGHYSANAIAQLGYETSNGLIIFAQYTHGLGNLSNTDGGPSIQHRVFGLSLGKFLNRKKIVMDTKNKE